ncbi:Ig-like domain-containing protein [Streptomyces sp. AJS327]|uniref:L,D-transpeptidase n=1 Tax=Streptomyces sp. AJS327 TaxID=2545265 RepID=UPI0027E421A4|nr:Ig-like domain-containing protein [Streptomyces sp. AJS327]
MDLRAVAREKLNWRTLREERRAQVIGGSAVGLVILLVVMLLALATCGGGGGSAAENNDGRGADGSDAPPRSLADIEISPRDGAKKVATTGALDVRVAKGKLGEVTVRDKDGGKVPGKVVKGGTAWRPDSHLATGTTYTVRAAAKDAEGRKATERSTFTTLTPGETFVGRFTPEDGSTVGAGMPVSFDFNHGITNRAAVEKAISVTAEPSVEIEGHWFGNNRLDFRPEEYWKSGTKVTMDLDLNGVEGADGVYGKQRKTVSFTVGRQQVSVVDAKKKTMTVTRDGKRVRTVPITSGSAEHPTYNGKMVVSEKHKVTRMNGDTVGFGTDESKGGYDIKDVPHAMRLSTSGTFIHGNYWLARSQFGQANGSHGCVGLFDKRGGGDKKTPGAWFYANSRVGDVVEVKNSQDRTIQPDNGLNGWNMSWDKWKAEQK